MPASNKNKQFMHLRELHLVPHYIYLVEQTAFDLRDHYSLQMWKDDMKMGQTGDIVQIPPNQEQKFTTLQFNNVKFAFDVQALFQDQAEAQITLKLSKKIKAQSQQSIEQFHIHILYYSYQFSKDKCVKFQENSIGRTKDYILNYSFSAIYGQPVDSLMFRKYEQDDLCQLLGNLKLKKKQSKYGQLIREIIQCNIQDTVVIDQMPEISREATPLISLENDEREEKMQKQETIMEDARLVARSMLQIGKIVLNDKQFDTSLVDSEFQSQKQKWSRILQYAVVLLGVIWIIALMHPTTKT